MNNQSSLLIKLCRSLYFHSSEEYVKSKFIEDKTFSKFQEKSENYIHTPCFKEGIYCLLNIQPSNNIHRHQFKIMNNNLFIKN